MGKTGKWLRTPKATPLQLLILFVGIFYALYMVTDIGDNWWNFVKVFIYGFFIFLSIIAGASMIDWKRLGYKIRRIMRNKSLSEEQRRERCLDILDEALYNIKKDIKKGGKKKNG
jgi:hypothetical protein